MRPRPTVLLAAALVAVAVGACGTEKSSKNVVTVVSTSSECQPSSSSLPVGRTTFKVQNKGNDVTELYVLQGNRTLGEVENVGPGTSRTLTVNLQSGVYDVTCKPGMKGEGIKASVTVVAAGPTDSSGQGEAPGPKVDVTAQDFSFSGLDSLRAHGGETVEFVLHNQGKEEHEFELFGPDGTKAGEISAVKPGETGSARILLRDPGEYTYVCGVDDHQAKGMKGSFRVSD